MTYRFIVSDLEKSLNQAFDDADITQIQVLYWVQVIANRLRTQYYKLKGDDSYVSTFAPVIVHTDAKGRKYIDLPSQILDLKQDAGVVFISYNFDTNCCKGDPRGQVVFERTHVGKLRTLYMDPYTTPQPKNPYFYRIADKVNEVDVNRIYLLGLECVKITDVEIGILATMDPRNLCNLDDEIPLPDELVSELILEVLKLGRFVMLVPDERLNDGNDGEQGDVPRVPTATPLEQPQAE